MQGPGGTYVPVFDDAIFDQERLLTYKECVLDGIVNSMRETLIAFIIKSVVRWTNQGFEGNPAYVTNLPLYMLERIADPEAERIITGIETEALAEPFRRDVRVALAKYYATKTRAPESALRCGLSDSQLESIARNDFLGSGGWQSFYTFTTNSSCNPLFAYYNASNRLNDAIAAEQDREQTQLDWGSGFRTVERDRTVDLGGGQITRLQRIVTPGFLIAEQLKQTIGTGLRQSENADEIDEIISALMANIGTEMLTDIEGLSGLSASFGGQAPYIDRLAADSAARTRGNMTGAAASVINNTIRVEQEYAATRQGSVTVASRTKRQLEAWENTCWGGILDKAREDLATRVEERACIQRGSTSTPCGISVTVTDSLATGSIGIRIPSAGTISVYGRASQGSSSVSLSATGAGETVGPVLPTVLTTGNWSTANPIDLSSIPDGTIVVSAVETLAGGGGTAAPVTANVYKVTTVTGIELTPPTTHPAITITATANGVTASATFATSTARSRAIVNTSVQPIVNLLRENIVRSTKALEVLVKLRDALASTTSASGQRFLLERLDQLVAARVLHTEAQLRQARDQATEIDAAMQQLLEETRGDWEAGWCDPDNWEQLVL
tara:strand:+ start:2435 stop:4273 length:1839 start_codon:yes stop_codon:yes gene_type:complete